MLVRSNLARLLNLSACCFNFCLSRSRDFINFYRQGLGEFAITQNFNKIRLMLYDTSSNQCRDINNVTSIKFSLKTTYIYRYILNSVEITETWKLRKTTCQGGLATFEAYTLTATRTRLLTIKTTTGCFTITRSRTAALTLTIAF